MSFKTINVVNFNFSAQNSLKFKKNTHKIPKPTASRRLRLLLQFRNRLPTRQRSPNKPGGRIMLQPLHVLPLRNRRPRQQQDRHFSEFHHPKRPFQPPPKLQPSINILHSTIKLVANRPPFTSNKNFGRILLDRESRRSLQNQDLHLRC